MNQEFGLPPFTEDRLQYQGPATGVVPGAIYLTDPTTADTNYPNGFMWVHKVSTTDTKIWIRVPDTTVWQLLEGTSGGVLPVADGGTGDNTLGLHGVLIGEGTNPVNVTTAGTLGQVLTSNGPSADPSFQTLPGTPTSGTATTTDDTLTAVITLPLGATAGVYTFFARVAGFASVGAGTPLGVGYTIEGSIRTDGAAATLVDQGANAFEEGALSACTGALVASGNDALIQVKGLIAYTIDWKADLSFTFAHA